MDDRRRGAPFRDYGFSPGLSTVQRESAFTADRSSATAADLTRDDLSLLANTMERLDAELQVDMKDFPHLRPKTTSAVPNDLELLSGAMSKIAQLEHDLTIFKRRAQKAELELQFMNRSAHAARHEPFYLEENKRLKMQLAEMEQFLADYGLIWIGPNDDGDDNDDESEADESGSHEIDWAVIKNNIRELNIMGGDGRSIVAPKHGAQQLVQNAGNLRLTLYSNGIMLGDGPFRTISQAKHFLDDVRDGYFPSELQSRYPDGLIFDLVDLHSEAFNQKFPGVGKRLKESEQNGSKMVPVIKTDDPRLIESDVSREMSETSCSLEDMARPSSRIQTAKAITLRVRNLDGKNHMIRMRSTETFAELRGYITREIKHSNFRILTLKESGWTAIEDEEQTLADVGLGPRAALQLAALRPKYDEMQSHIDNLKTSKVY